MEDFMDWAIQFKLISLFDIRQFWIANDDVSLYEQKRRFSEFYQSKIEMVFLIEVEKKFPICYPKEPDFKYFLWKNGYYGQVDWCNGSGMYGDNVWPDSSCSLVVSNYGKPSGSQGWGATKYYGLDHQNGYWDGEGNYGKPHYKMNGQGKGVLWQIEPTEIEKRC